jgi:hypothetical protein
MESEDEARDNNNNNDNEDDDGSDEEDSLDGQEDSFGETDVFAGEGSDAVSALEEEDEDAEAEGDATGPVQSLFMAEDLAKEQGRAAAVRPGSLTVRVKNLPVLLGGDNNEKNMLTTTTTNISFEGATTALEPPSCSGGSCHCWARTGASAESLEPLEVEGYQFDRHELFPQQDVDRLFGSVLRSRLPALNRLVFGDCTLPGSCLGLIASAQRVGT